MGSRPLKQTHTNTRAHTIYTQHTQSLHSCACMTCRWYFRQLATSPSQLNDPLNVALLQPADIHILSRKYCCSFFLNCIFWSVLDQWFFQQQCTITEFCVAKCSVYFRLVDVTISAWRTCALMRQQRQSWPLIDVTASSVLWCKMVTHWKAYRHVSNCIKKCRCCQ